MPEFFVYAAIGLFVSLIALLDGEYERRTFLESIVLFLMYILGWPIYVFTMFIHILNKYLED